MDFHLPVSALCFPSPRSEREEEEDVVGVKVWESLHSPVCNVPASVLECAVTGGEMHFQRKQEKKGGEKKAI